MTATQCTAQVRSGAGRRSPNGGPLLTAMGFGGGDCNSRRAAEHRAEPQQEQQQHAGGDQRRDETQGTKIDQPSHIQRRRGGRGALAELKR